MTKKNKILTTVLSVLSVIVLFIVLSSTIFAVGKIEVNWLTTRNNLSGVNSQTLVQDSNIKLGTNVFFVKKGQAIHNLEKKYPYIKIESIETVFPNNIIIHAREREEVFAISQAGSFLLVDSDFKVLKIVTSEPEKAIKILGDFSFEEKEGSFLNVPANMQAFKILEKSFYQNCDEEQKEFNLQTMKNLLKSATFSDTKIVFKTSLGVKIEMFNPSHKQQKKVAMINKILGTLDDAQKQIGTIIVGDNGDKVQGSYTANV